MKSFHKNPRTITEKQYADLDKWLAEFGDLSGIVHDLNTDEIIGGNQRSRVFGVEGRALVDLIKSSRIVLTETFDPPTAAGTVAQGYVYWHDEKYAYRQVRWTPEQCERANIIANKAGGAWDFDILANEFDFDVLLGSGFEKHELTGYDFGGNEQIDADSQEIEPSQEIANKWQVQPGDLWQIGSHKLLCGDSLLRSDVDVLIQGMAYCVLTDPPYNIGFNYNEHDDNLTASEYAAFCQAWFEMFQKADCMIFSPGPKNIRLYPQPRDTGYWLKRNASAGASAFNLRTVEPILIYGKIAQKRNFDLFDYSSGFPEELRAARWAAQVTDKHPPAKPLALWSDLIDMLALGLPVVDPFSGNGTTLIATHNKGRVCFGIEKDPQYCAVILERMQITFPHLKIERITEAAPSKSTNRSHVKHEA